MTKHGYVCVGAVLATVPLVGCYTTSPRELVEARLLEADHLYEAFLYRDAIRNYEFVARHRPLLKRAHLRLGIASETIHEPFKALHWYERIRDRIDSKDPLVLHALGRLYLETGFLPESANTYRMLVGLYPEDRCAQHMHKLVIGLMARHMGHESSNPTLSLAPAEVPALSRPIPAVQDSVIPTRPPVPSRMGPPIDPPKVEIVSSTVPAPPPVRPEVDLSAPPMMPGVLVSPLSRAEEKEEPPKPEPEPVPVPVVEEEVHPPEPAPLPEPVVQPEPPAVDVGKILEEADHLARHAAGFVKKLSNYETWPSERGELEKVISDAEQAQAALSSAVLKYSQARQQNESDGLARKVRMAESLHAYTVDTLAQLRSRLAAAR